MIYQPYPDAQIDFFVGLSRASAYWEEPRVELILIPIAGLTTWIRENENEFMSLQLGTQKGVMKDGTRFMYRVTEGDWLERLRGIRLKSYRVTRGVRLNNFETSALQAMMQMS